MTTQGSRILVADDDLTACLLLRAALEKAGFEVCTASDGAQALREFARSAFDMAMLDVDMPGLNGFEVCAVLRREAGDAFPIVMVTGMDDTGSIETAYQSGATDFMSKPLNWALIGHRVRYLLRAARAAHALRTANARNAAMLGAIPDTLLRLDRKARIVEVRSGAAPGTAERLPRSGLGLTDAYPPAAAQQLAKALDAAHATGTPQSADFSLVDTDERQRHFEARLVPIDGDEALCLVRDITDRKDNENRIFRLAYFDTLTGLANRQAFHERLEREIQRAQRDERRLAVLFMDLDHFKSVNDTLGHGAGDALLQEAARRLRNTLRPSDLVARATVELARLGGDEFTVLLPDIAHPDDALHIAERIRDAMQQPFALEGGSPRLSTSIGIALFPEDGHDSASLLKHADTAMYHAKDCGRNGARFYNTELTQAAVERMRLEISLRQALERDEFFLMYQPQLDAHSGRVTSVEALVRWRHPERGLVPPLDFIPFAEQNGMIVAIGRWVLHQACRDAAAWLHAGQPMQVAVNLSPLQFREPQLLEIIRGVLADTGLPPRWLELEVTESALMDDNETTLNTLLALRAEGIHIALDDFGTGYSSLSYLKRLPLSRIKVDKSFVIGLPDDRDNLAIVQAIVSLARHLGFSITAEGVETMEQARLLTELGSDSLQGYCFSTPVEVAALAELAQRSWEIRTASPDSARCGVTL
ncbi:EAL domain-containing protein [Thauera sp. JM12B12]|uniref:putative bifunctional diguanylate cyclase/phosphodiesterase n=1 Tax=Thauera sp. JM12B12 TaxID=3142262 RepID=UPI0031F46F99